MQDALKFVSTAVKSGPIMEPEHEHYVIRDGQVTAFNRALAMSAPFPVEWEATPKADMFRAAVDKAGDALAFEPQPGAVVVRSKRLKVAVPCLPDAPWLPVPDGTKLEAPGNLKARLEAAQPFVNSDLADTRKMLSSVLIGGGFYTAAFNAGAIQIWDGHDLPSIHVPDYMIKEILRVKDKPTHIQIGHSSLTVHYDGGRWIRGLLYEQPFPWEQVMRILDTPHQTLEPFSEGLIEAHKEITPFLEDSGAIYFRNAGLATTRYPDTGAHILVDGLPEGLCFTHRILGLALNVAHSIDWSDKGRAHAFYGESLRGRIMGRGVA